MLKACMSQEVWYFEDKVYPSAECREFTTGHSAMAYVQHGPSNRETGAPTTGVCTLCMYIQVSSRCTEDLEGGKRSIEHMPFS